jgi:hypothetical protein
VSSGDDCYLPFRVTMRFCRTASADVRHQERLLTGGLLVESNPGSKETYAHSGSEQARR